MDKLKLHTPDFTQENIARLAELFPNCVTEAQAEDGSIKRAIDFDQLRQELSDHVVDGPRERYHLNWPGKREAMLAGNAPIAKTLRPCREESIEFDTTKNLFIEGDNLDALKLLQETYLNKVKLIYIDPPYNTGNDFVYDDDFSESTARYFERSNQIDASGSRLIANTEANGRFHSDWLSMIYPRIRVAKSLLRDDGLIFISIGDNEFSNLRRICDEVFGESQFVGVFKWNRTSKAPTLSPKIRGKFEYVVCYERNDCVCMKGPDSYNTMAPLFNNGNKQSRIVFPAGAVEFLFSDGLYRKGVYGDGDKAVELHDDIEVTNSRNAGSFGMTARFKWSQETVNQRLSAGQRLAFKTATFTTMYYYLDDKEKFIAPSDLLDKEECGVLRNDEGYSELRELFDGSVVFDYPKPISLPKYLCRMANDPEGICLDFFAGSATTAHAVMSLNLEDGGTRRFILVQCPEECGVDSEASRIGLPTIAEVAKERIRRAGAELKREAGLQGQNLDIGFRVLKVDTSNMKDVYYMPDAVKKDALFDHIENIKEDRTPEDLLFQVLLDWGVDLSLPIAEEKIDGKTVFVVDENALAACFDNGITEELVKKLAARKPLRTVFRDSGFGSDAVKINVEQIFKLISPGTEVKAI